MALRKETEAEVKEILERLLIARKRAGLGQTQATHLIGYNSNASVSRIESGTKELTVGVMLQLAEIYDVDPTWVLTGVNTNFNPSAWRERIDNAAGQVREDLETVLNLLSSLSTGDSRYSEPDTVNGGVK